MEIIISHEESDDTKQFSIQMVNLVTTFEMTLIKEQLIVTHDLDWKQSQILDLL